MLSEQFENYISNFEPDISFIVIRLLGFFLILTKYTTYKYMDCTF